MVGLFFLGKLLGITLTCTIQFFQEGSFNLSQHCGRDWGFAVFNYNYFIFYRWCNCPHLQIFLLGHETNWHISVLQAMPNASEALSGAWGVSQVYYLELWKFNFSEMLIMVSKIVKGHNESKSQYPGLMIISS